VERIAAIADATSVQSLDAPRPSRWLARFGIAPRDDDGIATARVRIGGMPWLVAAQDERFLGGSVGAAHGAALRTLFERARDERPAGVALLAASAGVRLHEANAGEWALAQALRALLDARIAGIATAALCVGDTFGGASVLAAATDRLGMLPGVRYGVSGPKVIEAARGRAELDASDTAATAALFGASARVAAGLAEALVDDATVVRAWLGAGHASSFADEVTSRRLRLRPVATSADVLDPRFRAHRIAPRLWRNADAWIVAPFGARHVDPAALAALDDAMLAHVGRPGDEGPALVVLLEDSAGHDASVAAERAGLSHDLARHAAVLALLRTRGIRVVGVLTGIGHSAAFFVNALQADIRLAVRDARVVAMAPEAIRRVTGVAGDGDDDPMLGQPVRHLRARGGIDALIDDGSPETILAAVRAALG
jgi:biotin-independent malonate decarboxylase beta subunit